VAVFDSILITGGRGMLAQALKRALQSRGLTANSPGHGELDLTDGLALADAFARYKPTLVLNCAAYTKVDLAEEQLEQAMDANARGPGLLAQSVAKHGAKLVHFSTDFVFDGKSERPYRPDDPDGALSVYGASKWLGEQQVRAFATDAIIIRTAWLYGPGGACFPQTILNAANAGKPLRVVNDQTGTPTYTRDLADATLALIEANARGTFHFTNAGETTWFDFTRAILDEFKIAADLQPITSADWQALRPKSAVRPAYSVLGTADYTRVTGKTPRPWREALADYRAALEA
jgi:dTDP-4-dehydrorhamnose reductase